MKMVVTSRDARTPAGEILAWDSEFWQARIGRGYSSDIDQWARENMVGCVCFLVDADDIETVQDLESRGARLMDIRVQLTTQTQIQLHARPVYNTCRPYQPSDLDTLVQIARSSHRITRFYADPRFPDERCHDLYESWIRSSVDGWAQYTVVADTGDGPVGYCTVHLNGDTASIGLIAVDVHHRGGGHGTALVNSAKEWAYQQGVSEMTVVTQGRNIAALRTFEGCGFRVTDTSLWLHRWYT